MSRWSRRAVVVAMLLVGGAGRAAAQTCGGYTTIDTSHRGRVGGALAVSSHTVGIYADVAAGSTYGFGSFQLGRTHYKDFATSTNVAGASLAGQVPLHRSRRVWACPGVGYSVEWGTFAGFAGDIDILDTFATGGVDVGAVVASSSGFQFVPTFGVAGGRFRSSATAAGDTLTGHDTGIGFGYR